MKFPARLASKIQMKEFKKSKRMSKRRKADELWRNAQAEALAAYMADKQANPGLPALGSVEINELYGRPDLNPMLRQK